MPAGSIVVELLAKTGSFETDTARAGRALKKLEKDAADSARAIKASFVGNLLAGFAKDLIYELGSVPGRLAAVVTGAIDAADHLNDLAKKTGIAADTLGGIGFAAKQSGGDLDSAAAAAGKLNKSLAEAASGNKQALEAFDLLGVSVKDAAGATKNADVVLAELADKFAGYADGPEKAALALRIFGKAGADIIPLLDEGGAALQANIDYFKRYSGVTLETARAADQFNDTQTKINLLSQAFGTTLASQALPLMQTLADRFLAAKEQGDGFKTAADGIVGVLKGLVIAGAYVVDTFQGVGREIGAIAAQGVALAHLDFKGFKAISEAVTADGEEAKKRLARFVADIQNPFQNDPSNYSNEGRNRATVKKPPAPRLPGSGAGAKSAPDTEAARLKKILDSQIRLIQDFERSQAAAFQLGEQFLAGVFQDGLTTQADFFDKQKSLRDANLQNTLDAIDKEIAAQRKYIADLQGTKAPTPEAKEKRDTSILEANERIKLSIQQRADAETKASAAEILAKQQNERATRQLAEAYDSLRGATLSAMGDDFGAQQLRNAQQVRAARELIAQQGGDPKIADDLEKALAAQNAFTRAQKESSAVSTRLQIAEERIALAVKTGALSEIDALQATGQARQAVVAQLEAQLAVQQRLAASLPDDTALALNVERTRLELDKLKASLDPLKEKFDDVFKDAGANAFSDLLNDPGNIKGALDRFFTNVARDVNDTLSKELSRQVFGKDGIAGGLGGIFAAAFGQKSGGGLLSDSDAAKAKQQNEAESAERASIEALFGVAKAATGATDILGQLTTIPATAALGELAGAAQIAAAALGQIGGTSSASSSDGGIFGSILGAIGSSFGGGYSANGGVGYSNAAGISGGRADGGPVMPGQTYIVGERGPERLVMGKQGGTVIPNGGGARPISLTVNFSGNVDRQQARTAAQLVMEQLRAAQAQAVRGTA